MAESFFILYLHSCLWFGCLVLSYSGLEYLSFQRHFDLTSWFGLVYISWCYSVLCSHSHLHSCSCFVHSFSPLAFFFPLAFANGGWVLGACAYGLLSFPTTLFPPAEVDSVSSTFYTYIGGTFSRFFSLSFFVCASLCVCVLGIGYV